MLFIYQNRALEYHKNKYPDDSHQTADISSVHHDDLVLSEISPLKLTLAGYPIHSSDTDILKVMMMMVIMMALLMSHAWSRSR